jgi:hypothetical protein
LPELRPARGEQLDFRGTFRFDGEFAEVASALEKERTKPAPLITDRFKHLKALIYFN